MGSRTRSSKSAGAWEDIAGSATTHWREEGDFVACVEWGLPGAEFAVAGGHQRAAIAGEFGIARGTAREQLFKRRSFDDFQRVFGIADNLFESAEEKHADANGWRGLFHREIVTCGRG